MGNLASELAYLLASTGAGGADAEASRILFDGDMFAGAIAAMAALGSAIFFLFRAQHRDVEAHALALEQIASTEFVRLVIRESRRVFSIVDEHLPSLLSQRDSVSPQPSRFDQFCEAVKKIPEGQLDERGHYAKIIEDHLGGIVSASARRLLDTLDANDTALQHTVLNPTRANFGLEGDTFLTFVVVSKFDSRNRRIESWFWRTWIATAVLLVLPLLASASVLIATTTEAGWAEVLTTWCVRAGVTGFVAAVLSYLACFLLKLALARRVRRFSDPAVVQKFLGDEKGRHGRNDH